MITELLSPAGSYESFEAAIGAGADAVYVGGPAFGARAYAQNFTQEELITAIETAHIHNRKLYLTVNTLLKNRELDDQLFEYLLPYYEAGLDAVIVQDLGVFSFIRRNFPDLDIHASTQMTVTGPEGMRFLEEKGATRVVPARELSLEEISAMHKASPLEIETFIHGALCYSYSGQCLMSSIFGGRSGNRGRCAQPCRLPYSVTMDHRKYKGDKDFCALSLKDICTLDILPDILEAGVMSLKIEGRMKQPAYTAGVTAVYRKYLDMYLSGKEYHVQEKDRKYLLELFSRGGSCKGYYDMYRGPEMMAFANEKKSGNIQPEIRKIKEKIHGNLILSPESPVILEITCKGQTVTAMGGEVQFAKNQPMEEQRIRQQMEKLGNTDFQWEDLNIEINGRIFVPVKVLNEVRRDALSQLREALIGCQKRAQVTKQPTKSKDQAACHRRVTDSLPVYVSCERSDTAEVLLNEPGITGFYFPFDTMEKYFSPELAASSELYLFTPHIHRGEIPEKWLRSAQKWLEQGMKGFLVRNLESYAVLKKMGYGGKCILDASMYTWNDQSVDFWREEGVLRNTVPLELNEGELKHRDNTSSELLLYGYIPLMLSAQCVRKNLFGCTGKYETAYLKDRYNSEFPVKCSCDPWGKNISEKAKYCYNIIYNSIPYGLPGEKDQVKKLNLHSLRLAFTIEEPEKAKAILKEFRTVYQENGKPSGRRYTKGHFKRGAE
ncbi:peptidase U32 family protein [Blautia massiliensis (ex Durand et al. 2017)]|uniref:peptidase U32 family protein n=1 Tax=Blautia massiliensis (ex Durand et al. 2017) TaxID=1737424 RepID=UPI0022E00811|nr:U32 family peptidase [Blautia massiliensis (ex Durand et al. 2017)]